MKEKRKNKRHMRKKQNTKRENEGPAKARRQIGADGGTWRQDKTRKNISSRKFIFPCHLSCRQVDDVPPGRKTCYGGENLKMTQNKSDFFPRSLTHPNSSRRRERAAMLSP